MRLVSAVFVSVTALAAGTTAAKQTQNAEEVFNGFLHRALSEQSAHRLNDAIDDFTKAIAAAPNSSESADAYKFRAGAERTAGDLDAATQDEVNADYVALGWSASAAAPNPDLSACRTAPSSANTDPGYRAYSGCPLPPGRNAILRLIGVRVRAVDGRPFFNAPAHGKSSKEAYVESSRTLELPPGVHSIFFILPRPATCSLTFLSRCPDDAGVLYTGLTLDAGKSYTAAGRGLSSGDWIPIIAATGYKMPISPSPTWELPIWPDGSGVASHHIEITEQRTSSAEYLRLYDTDMNDHDPDAAFSALNTALVLFPNDPDRKTVEKTAADLRATLQKREIDFRRGALRDAAGLNGVRPPVPKIPTCRAESETPDEAAKDTDQGNDEAAAADEPQELATVLSRASDYVEEYEAKLGSLIGREVYFQNAMWKGPFSRNERRQTESDFAIRQLGRSWIGVRSVNCVNGKAVKQKTEGFESVLANVPDEEIKRTVDRIDTANAAYNISDFHRTTNQPTFGLEVLYHENAGHFEFQKAGETNIDNIPAWMINFREIHGPTLVTDGSGRDQPSTGILWIEPVTGRVLKTELSVPHEYYPAFSARTIVSFQYDGRLKMLLPASMNEHYDSDGEVLDSHAEYFDFRRLNVDAHFDFGEPPAPKTPPRLRENK